MNAVLTPFKVRRWWFVGQLIQGPDVAHLPTANQAFAQQAAWLLAPGTSHVTIDRYDPRVGDYWTVSSETGPVRPANTGAGRRTSRGW